MEPGAYDVFLPCDPHAEGAVINFAQVNPGQLLDLGLAPTEFYIPDHRRLWQAMVRVVLEHNLTRPGQFYLALLEEVAHDDSTHSVLEAVDPQTDWMFEQSSPDSPVRGIQWCVDQIKRCQQARNLIDAAQQIAEHAFKVPVENFDVTDASAVLSRVAGVPTREELGMTLPI